MAIYRQLQTTFWSDSFIASLTPEQKYFYIYLLTNDNTKQCGIYEITTRKIAFDTGYNQETVEKLLEIFETNKKIKWSKTTNEIALVNWAKYNNHGSPKVQSCIQKELKNIKNKSLIEYLYGIDTISQEEEEQEQKETNNKPNKPNKKQLFYDSSNLGIEKSNLPETQKTLLKEWVKYKYEVKKEVYETLAFITKYENDIKEYGFESIKSAIELAKANEYKGYFPKPIQTYPKANIVQPEPLKQENPLELLPNRITEIYNIGHLENLGQEKCKTMFGYIKKETPDKFLNESEKWYKILYL